MALLIFFPIIWTILTSFKTESRGDRVAAGLVRSSTGRWRTTSRSRTRRNYFRYFVNSVIISVGSTLLGLLIAIPAAWAMAFVPGRRTKDVLMWMLSTKMMPGVGVLVPIYLMFIQPACSTPGSASSS